MGCLKPFSTSSYDGPSFTVKEFVKCVKERIQNMGISGLTLSSCSSYDEPSTNKNPDPKNYKVKRAWEKNGVSVLLVNYPDSENYEGNKILVFEGSVDDILKQGVLDPHFSENGKFFSPFARFEPTDRGWQMAMTLANEFKRRIWPKSNIGWTS